MIYIVNNFKIKSKNIKFFKRFPAYKEIEKSLNYDLEVIFVNFAETKNVGKLIYSHDYIDIFKNDGNYYFYCENKLINTLVFENNQCKVEFSEKISEEAFVEILLKKILPLFCYETKKAIPFHSTCIYKGEKILGISGASMSGKSTLAASFILDEKYELFSDDILLLTFENQKVLSFRGFYDLKLREESSKYFSQNRLLREINVSDDVEKIPINNIVFIKKSNEENINISLIKKNKLQLFLQNLYMSSFCDFSSEILLKIKNIVENLNFWEIEYPHKYEFLHEVRSNIIERL